ncbi:hypothetical protein [Streptomyces sp. NPDC096132]|uniref:hypothetical protein n=1 Tax=Streptomyces sp. NPDC096132 TaxID=3366075 RepID=UPI003818D736
MIRRALLVSSLLLTTVTGCAALGLEHPPTADPADPSARASTSKPAAPSTPPVLTDTQAQAALITDTDLGAPWIPTQGAATWRDGLLKASTPVAECQKLLDALYTDELFGAPARAVVGLDDPDRSAQLRYQLTGKGPADADRTLAWLRSLPQKCARFTARAGQDIVEDVQVTDLPLPEVGDARQGLRVSLTLWGTAEDNADGEPTVLVLDVAAVRAGEDAFALTNGALDDVPNEATQAAVQLGVRRLEDVRKQGRVQV